MLGSAGWGDACVIVPWELYQLYGDEAILDELWPTMVRWLDYAADVGPDEAPSRPRRGPPVPAAHEEFLWDGGWHWGEWCEPDTDGEPFWSADQGHVATAYLHHSATLAARIGRLLGHDDDAAALDELAGRRARRLADASTSPTTARSDPGHAGQPRPRPRLRPRARRAARPDRADGWSS